MSDGISKGERDELRRIVRGDFKALWMEVEVRKAEMLAEIEKRVAQRFLAHETVIAEAEKEVAGIVATANEGIARVLRDCESKCEGYTLTWHPLEPPLMRFMREKRRELRAAMVADLEARVSGARSKMARQENDLLKRLASGALASDEARAFLDSIPKVAELVPSSRLAQLEAEFDAEEDR